MAVPISQAGTSSTSTNTTVTSIDINNAKILNNREEYSTMEVTTDCMTSKDQDMTVVGAVLKDQETAKKSNKSIEEAQYLYPVTKENIEMLKVPENSPDTKFICQPVSNDETNLNLEEQSPRYGLECVAILDEIAFDEEDNEY